MKMETRSKVFSWTIAVVCLVISFAKYGNSLDLEGAKGQSCFKIENTIPMDLMGSVKKWYHPVMHRLDLCNSAVELLKQSAKEIPEDELFYDGCVTFETKGSFYFLRGFNGQLAIGQVKPGHPDLSTIQFTMSKGYNGTCYSTLTDNKTFYFGACCIITGNQMVWAVSSKYATLPTETVKLIHEHAESLGFKTEFFSRLQYDSCKEVKQGGHNDEL